MWDQLRIRRVCGATLLLGFWVAASAAIAEGAVPRAQDLLMRMTGASKNLNYDGIFIYQRGDQIDTMRIIHRADGDVERERLVSLTGAAREVVRDGEAVKCYFPDDKAVVVEKIRPRKLFLSELSRPLEKIAELYTFDVTGRDRVAGRDAWMVAIAPRGSHRYGYRLWIDEESGLLLRSNIMDAGGVSLEQIIFTKLDLPAYIPDELLRSEVTDHNFTQLTNEQRATAENTPAESNGVGKDWVVSWLPQGFVMKDAETQEMSPSSTPVRHLVFTDGLAMVSVFVERAMPGAEHMQGFSSMGAVNAYSTKHADVQVTVVGEVPRSTVRQIAQSVAPAAAKN